MNKRLLCTSEDMESNPFRVSTPNGLRCAVALLQLEAMFPTSSTGLEASKLVEYYRFLLTNHTFYRRIRAARYRGLWLRAVLQCPPVWALVFYSINS